MHNKLARQPLFTVHFLGPSHKATLPETPNPFPPVSLLLYNLSLFVKIVYKLRVLNASLTHGSLLLVHMYIIKSVFLSLVSLPFLSLIAGPPLLNLKGEREVFSSPT